jgi:hypothetical protein
VPNNPPVINNVSYGNGGRCMQAYIVTNFWIVNNTCYDTREGAEIFTIALATDLPRQLLAREPLASPVAGPKTQESYRRRSSGRAMVMKSAGS